MWCQWYGLIQWKIVQGDVLLERVERMTGKEMTELCVPPTSDGSECAFLDLDDEMKAQWAEMISTDDDSLL
jgi:hypothetical protein